MTRRAMNPKLEAAIKRAIARGPMTPEEYEAQKRSFVRAEMGFGSDADEAAYRVALDAGDAEALARLDRESDERMAAADAYFSRRPTSTEGGE